MMKLFNGRTSLDIAIVVIIIFYIANINQSNLIRTSNNHLKVFSFCSVNKCPISGAHDFSSLPSVLAREQ